MMQEDNQHNEKKFEIIEEYHRDRPKQKIYKIRVSMVAIMHKAEQKLRMKFERQPSNDHQPSNSHIENRHAHNNDILDDIFEQTTNQEEPHHPPINNQRHQAPTVQQRPIKIYEDFKNRGKFDNLKFHFSKEKQRITLIINAKYFLNELKLKEFDLLMIYHSFTKIWQEEYIHVMQTFIKYWKEFKNPDQYIKFQFVAIDILGVTFQVIFCVCKIAYSNKVNDKVVELKRFRFRYSPFEFRQNPLFQQKNTEQTISFVEIHSNNLSVFNHNDFYISMRLGFIDDINNSGSDLWKRMITRFWVFYQLHCLNRGISDYEEFNKKALGKVHFHPVRMKKFQLVFPFPLLHKNIIDERAEGMIYFTFYLDEKEINITESGLEFKINVNIVEHYGILTFEQKRQIFSRLSKDDSFTLTEKQNLAPNELFEFWMVLKFDEKISKAFARFETIVSFFLDKIAYNDVRQTHQTHGNKAQLDDPDNERIIEIVRELEPYDESKNVETGQKAGQFIHYHTLILELKHKHSIPSVYPGTNIPRLVDETTFFKLCKRKRKYNTARKEKEESIQKADLFINQDIRKYLNQILKIKPLRQCHREVMDYVEKVVKIIYAPFKDSNEVKMVVQKENTLSLIITNICKLLEVGNNHTRRSEITIINDRDPLMVRDEGEEDLIAEVTFNIKEFKVHYIKRLPEGYIILRMFEKRLEIVKDLNFKTSIDINFINIEQTGEELLKELRNILTKEFATLQNMMI